MKRKSIMGFLALVCLAGATEPNQKQMTFIPGTSDTWIADWEGEVGFAGNRVFFFQCSFDLVNWRYAPFMEFGIGQKSYGLETEGAPRVFLRLRYEDDPDVHTLQQAELLDHDGDGLPSAWEVANFFDPYGPNSGSELLQNLAAQPAAPAIFELHTPLQ